MVTKGTVVNFVKIIKGNTVTGTGALTVQATDDARTVNIRVITTSHPLLLAVDAYAEVTRVK